MSDFEIRSVPRMDTAVVTASAAPDAIGESMAQVLPKAFEAVAKSSATPAGPPFARYFSFGGATIEYEGGVPVAAPFVGDGEVKPSELGGGEAAVAMHLGSYDTISDTWGALSKWVENQGRKPAGPGWESYLTDPGEEPDPSKWVTEVYLPVR